MNDDRFFSKETKKPGAAERLESKWDSYGLSLSPLPKFNGQTFIEALSKYVFQLH